MNKPTSSLFVLTEHTKEAVDAQLQPSQLAGDAHEPAISGNTVVGLLSQNCYVRAFPLTHFAKTPAQGFLAFDTEQWLPINAEHLAVTALRHSDGWLLLATDGEKVRNEIDARRTDSAFVVAVCPLIILAWEALRRELVASELQRLEAGVWQSGTSVDLLRFSKGTIIDWRWLAADSPLLEDTLSSWSAADRSDPHPILAVDCDDSLQKRLASLGEIQSVDTPCSIISLAEKTAFDISEGRRSAPVDLRSGPLKPDNHLRPILGPLRAACISVLLLMAAAAVAMAALSWRYRAEAEASIAQQEEVFRELFPGEQPPTGLRSRLESEHRRLAGTRGVNSDSVPVVNSAIVTLHAFLAVMPPDARYRIDRLELAPNQILLLSGSARSYSDAERVAEAMRIGGFVVPPISATKQGDGVSFRLENIPRRTKTASANEKSAVLPTEAEEFRR